MQKKDNYKEFWNQYSLSKEINITGEYLDSTVEYLSDCRDNNVVDKLSDYPWIYDTFFLTPTHPRWIADILKWLMPIGYIIYLVSLKKRKELIKTLDSTIALSKELAGILSGNLR